MTSPSLRSRKWTRYLWLLLAVVLAGGAIVALRGRPAKPVSVRVHTVERGTVRDRVSTVAAGRVTARREVTLRAEFAGTVIALHHRRGDRVRAGDPLLAFDVDDLRDRVAVAESAVVLGRAQAAQAAASARLAQDNAERARRLEAVGATAPAEAENLAAQEEIARRAKQAAQASIGQGVANVEVARNALRKAVVRAPFDGIVLGTSVEEGETTAPGGPLVAFADTGDLYVTGEIDESDLGKLEEGMPAEVAIDAFPGQRFDGKVRRIAPSVTRDLRGNRSVIVEVTLPPEPRLRVGMSADVDVIVATRADVLSVPPNAVHGRGKDRTVLVAVGGVARRRPIEVGISTWEAVEVTRGLEVGDKVIVSQPSVEIADGARVEIEATTPPPPSGDKVSKR